MPEAYIAPRELRELRDLLRHRVALTRMRSALKNRAGAILAKRGVQRPYSDLFGPSGFSTRSSCLRARAAGSTARSR
jgi:hypothetical protein